MIIGQIESYNIEKQTGIAKSQDDFFEFDATSWKSSVPPDQGDEVTFNVNDGVVSNMLLVAETMKPVEAVKSKKIAYLLSILIGTGLHRHYLGFYKLGLAQLAFSVATGGFGVVWGFIDAVLLFAGHINRDAKNRPLK